MNTSITATAFPPSADALQRDQAIAEPQRSVRSRFAAAIAFFVTVFASMAAAAAVAVTDIPLMVVGL